MIHNKLKYIFLLLIGLLAQTAFAQYPNRYNNGNPTQQPNSPFADTTHRQARQLSTDQEIDTLRKQEEGRNDSVIFTSKFIRITNESLLKDSTQIFPIDTGLTNFENYSPLYQPKNPRIGLGYVGVAQRSLLFEPDRTIGFDVGLHSLDPYLLQPQNLNYYKARVPYTLLSLFTGGTKEQIFKVVHSQNIKPNWNIGFDLNFIGSRGFYATNGILGQNVSDFSAALFTWYESLNKRYNLLANIITNNLKAPETGSLIPTYDDIFTTAQGAVFSKTNVAVRLPNTFENWKDNGLYIKQFYYIGHIDTVKKGLETTNILPTQRVAYTLRYNVRKYNFLQNDMDAYNVFPDYYYSANRSRDSLTVLHLQNDFDYSFSLRNKSAKTVKNEVKLDVGLTQDFYHYTQYVSDSTVNAYGTKVVHPDKMQDATFQNITVKGKLSYRFSDRVGFAADVNQIVQGRNFGDFIYDAKLMLAGNNKTGKIILDAYTQSSSPGLVYNDWISNHYIFHNSFHNQKTNSFSFNYVNNALQVDLKAQYFLITDYLYFAADAGGTNAHPLQLGNPINLLKVTLSKNLQFGRWHFDNSIIYQKTDYQNVLRTPEVYTYSSLYYGKLLFNILNTDMGMNVRYNTPYVAPSFAPGIDQFYNGPNITFSSYPVATVFIKATLYRTNLFVAYDYANQGLFSKGYYTVNRYPMQDHLLKFGVAWTFYN